MALNLKALQQQLEAAIKQGALDLQPATIPAQPLQSFIETLSGKVLALVNVTPPVLNADQSQLTLGGDVAGPWTVSAQLAVLQRIKIEITVTADPAAAALTVQSSQLVWSAGGAKLFPALDMAGALVDEGVPFLRLAVSGAVPPQSNFSLSRLIEGLALGNAGDFLPAGVLAVNPVFKQSFPLQDLGLDFAVNAAVETVFRFTQTINKSIDILGSKNFAFDISTFAVSAGYWNVNAQRVSTGASITVNGNLNISGKPAVDAAITVSDGGTWRLSMGAAKPLGADVIEWLAKQVGISVSLKKELAKLGIKKPPGLTGFIVDFSTGDLKPQRVWVAMQVEIFGHQVDGSISFPDFSVSVGSPESADDPDHQANAFSLEDLTAQFAHDMGLKSKGEPVYLAGFGITATPLQELYSIGAEIDSTCSLTIGDIDISFDSLGLGILVSKDGVSVTVTGSATIDEIVVSALVEYDSGSGWQFALDAYDNVPASLDTALQSIANILDLGSDVIVLPSDLPVTLKLEDLSLSFNSADKSFSIAASGDVGLKILGKQLNLEGAVSVSSSVDAGKRSWSLVTDVEWTVAKMTFLLNYQYDSDNNAKNNQLSGYWIDSGAPVHPIDILGAIDIPVPSWLKKLADDIDLGLDAVFFDLDFAKEQLVLGGVLNLGKEDIDVYGLLCIGRYSGAATGSDWDIILGIGMHATSAGGLTLADLPKIGNDLKPFSFIGLQNACMVLSNQTFSNTFTLPSLPAYGGDDDPFSVIGDIAGIGLSGAQGKSDIVLTAAAEVDVNALLAQKNNPDPKIQQQLTTATKLLGGKTFDAKLLIEASLGLSSNPTVTLTIDLETPHLALSISKDLKFGVKDAFLTLVLDEAGVILNIGGSIDGKLPSLKKGGKPIAYALTGGVDAEYQDGDALLEAYFDLDTRLPIPGYNIDILNIGAGLGINLGEGEGIAASVEGVFADSTNASNVYELAAMGTVDLEGEIPVVNLIAFVLYISKLNISQIVHLLNIRAPAGLDLLDVFTLTDLYLAWSEGAGGGNILPDGSVLPDGFQFATAIKIYKFEGYMNTKADLQSFTFSAEGACDRLVLFSEDALVISGDGKDITTKTITRTINNKQVHQPVLTKKDYNSKEAKPKIVVHGGGPTLSINSSSPFIHLDFKVKLLKSDIAKVDITVTSTEVQFSGDFHIPELGKFKMTFHLDDHGVGASGSYELKGGALKIFNTIDFGLVTIEHIVITLEFDIGSDFSLKVSFDIRAKTPLHHHDHYRNYGFSISYSDPPDVKDIIKDVIHEVGKFVKHEIIG